MATASIRTAIPALARAIMAAALVVAMVAAFVVAPAGHASTDGFGLVSSATQSDDGSGPEADHAANACHGCVGHAAGFLSAPVSMILARVTEADLVAPDDASPAMPARIPVDEPPRA